MAFSGGISIKNLIIIGISIVIIALLVIVIGGATGLIDTSNLTNRVQKLLKKNQGVEVVITDLNPQLFVNMASQKKLNVITENFPKIFETAAIYTVNVELITNSNNIVIKKWGDITYASYSADSLGNTATIKLFIDVEAVKNHGWSERMIAKELELMFIEALFEIENEIFRPTTQVNDAALFAVRNSTVSLEKYKELSSIEGSTLFGVSYE